jgi:hypothetical protein
VRQAPQGRAGSREEAQVERHVRWRAGPSANWCAVVEARYRAGLSANCCALAEPS